jgi:outer membrane beta-barrel protein
MNKIIFSLSILFCTFATELHAQVGSETADENLDLIEAELSKDRSETIGIPRDRKDAFQVKTNTVSDLSRLDEFSNFFVIQKRWMPKTSRVSFFAGAATMTNDPWFLTAGGIGRIGYGFTEKWGLELSGMTFSSSPNSSAKDLEQNNGILTSSFVTPKSYLGAQITWTPIYGKVTLFNRHITPFDMYFYVGTGSLSLQNSSSSSASAFQIGTGQIFAITRSFGFRWDLSVLNYSAKSNEGVGGSFNNVFLSAGVSLYVPEVGVR